MQYLNNCLNERSERENVWNTINFLVISCTVRLISVNIEFTRRLYADMSVTSNLEKYKRCGIKHVCIFHCAVVFLFNMSGSKSLLHSEGLNGIIYYRFSYNAQQYMT